MPTQNAQDYLRNEHFLRLTVGEQNVVLRALGFSRNDVNPQSNNGAQVSLTREQHEQRAELVRIYLSAHPKATNNEVNIELRKKWDSGMSSEKIDEIRNVLSPLFNHFVSANLKIAEVESLVVDRGYVIDAGRYPSSRRRVRFVDSVVPTEDISKLATAV